MEYEKESDEILNLLRRKDLQPAYKETYELLEDVISSLGKIKQDNSREYTQALNNVEVLVGEIINATKTNDVVYLYDLLKYELKPQLNLISSGR